MDTQPTKETIQALQAIYKNLYSACNFMEIFTDFDAMEDKLTLGHEEVINRVHELLQAEFAHLEKLYNPLGVKKYGLFEYEFDDAGNVIKEPTDHE